MNSVLESRGVNAHSLTDKEIIDLHDSGFKFIKSKTTKEIFDNFLYEYMGKKQFTLSQHISYFRNASRIFIELIRYLDCSDISWKKYCEIMHQINDLKDEKSRLLPFLRDFLCEFFLMYIKSVPKGEHKNIDELYEYSNLLISEEKMLTPFPAINGQKILDRKIRTNFSIDSIPNQIYRHEFLSKSGNKENMSLIDLNTSNNKLQRVLISFIQTLKPKELTYVHIRTFVYYFSYSLIGSGNEVNSIQDFNYSTFKKQYRFYSNISQFFGFSKKVGLKNVLTKFYVSLLRYIKENRIDHQVFKGTLIDEHYLTSVYFYNYYEEGYVRVNHSHLEEIPLEDRWVVHSDSNKANTHSESLKVLDFTKISDSQFKRHLKEYYWNQDSASFKSVTNYSHVLMEFLNEKSCYDNKRKNVYSFDEKSNLGFSNEFLYYQISKIKQKYPEQETRRKMLGSIKQYLTYYRNLEIYQINELLLEELSTKAKKDYSGNPIGSEDLKLIINTFRDKKKCSIVNELFYIIVVLAVSTKLRAGEIINLKRNCIINRTNEGGKVVYFSKPSGEETVNIFLTLDKIRLLERAILITESYSNKASINISNYIFLSQDFRHTDRIVRIGTQFTFEFSQVVNSLEGMLKGKYSANNLRHTFIDTIYNEGIKENLHPLVMVEMVGNSPSIALKHYREKTNLIRYAEMFSGVTISNVDINGKIFEEEDIVRNNPVLLNAENEGLGACVQSNCTEDRVDEEYKCLICSYFATTVQRLSMFRVKIEDLKKRRKLVTQKEEINLIDINLKLYTAYYAKLLELRSK
jgi:integrase